MWRWTQASLFAINSELNYLEPLLLENNSESEVVYYETVDACLEAVINGEAEMAIVEEYAANASEKKISYARGRTLTAYRFTDGVVVSWRDGKCGMALYGERDLDLADALAVASQIVEANYG